jgi:branched-subunit amino acid aminotransferase/4-amino-4-deoxychorismate lyase
MTKVWLNGALVDSVSAQVQANDRGFLLGEAAFETLRWDAGKIRRWPRHRARLGAGLKFLGLPVPDLEGVEAAAGELASANQIDDGVLRLTVSGGPGTGFAPPLDVSPTVVMTLTPRPSPPTKVSLFTQPGVGRGGLPSEAFKLSGYAMSLSARRMAHAAGADMAVLLGPDGQTPACADTANLYWVTPRGELVTPALSLGALAGTARAALLEAAPRAGLSIREMGAGEGHWDQALAACISNAIVGVVPVGAVDGCGLRLDHPVVLALQELELTAD